MKIKVENMWENIGVVFTNPEDIVADMKEDDNFTILKKGIYIVVSQEEHGYNLYEIKEGRNVLFEAGWVDENVSFDVFYMSPLETLDLLIEAVSKIIITLSSEGWIDDPNEKYFSLTPYMRQLEALSHAKLIISQAENDVRS